VSLTEVQAPDGTLHERAQRAAAIAAEHADDVDTRARFPHEAVAALRDERLLGVGVPLGLGGEAAGLADLANASEVLGRACSATATVFTMHQIQVACLARHTRTPALDAALRAVADRQLLLASATTESGKGGDVRSSTCAVVRDGTAFLLTKQCPVVSYGEHADGVLATARRDPGSTDNDQVLVLCLPPGLGLEPTSEWDALGYRGTRSRGFTLTARGDADLVLPDSYDAVSARTMLPFSHVLWAHAWTGLAAEAGDRAQRFVRAQARRQPGTMPPGAAGLAELAGVLQQMRALAADGLARVERAGDDGEALTTYAATVALNSLKVLTSTLVADVADRALLICGMAGYANGTPYSLGRLLRDAHGAALMLSNDRLALTNAQLLLAAHGV